MNRQPEDNPFATPQADAGQNDPTLVDPAVALRRLPDAWLFLIRHLNLANLAIFGVWNFVVWFLVGIPFLVGLVSFWVGNFLFMLIVTFGTHRYLAGSRIIPQREVVREYQRRKDERRRARGAGSSP